MLQDTYYAPFYKMQYKSQVYPGMCQVSAQITLQIIY